MFELINHLVDRFDSVSTGTLFRVSNTFTFNLYPSLVVRDTTSTQHNIYLYTSLDQQLDHISTW